MSKILIWNYIFQCRLHRFTSQLFDRASTFVILKLGQYYSMVINTSFLIGLAKESCWSKCRGTNSMAYGPGGSMWHSQVLSNNPHRKTNQCNSSFWYLFVFQVHSNIVLLRTLRPSGRSLAFKFICKIFESNPNYFHSACMTFTSKSSIFNHLTTSI